MQGGLPELNTVIRTFGNEVEAHVAQAVLDANGIDSNLIRDDAGGMMPWLQWLHPQAAHQHSPIHGSNCGASALRILFRR